MKRILISAMVGMVIGLVLAAALGPKILSPTPEQVVDHISHMSFPELAAFNRKLVAQSGLQVYQTQMVPTAPSLPVPPVIPVAPGK